MWGTVILFLLFLGGIAWWDGRKVYRNKTKKDLWVYLGLIGVVAVFGSLSMLGMRIPSPMDPLETYVAPLGKLLIGG